ncbi:hypothetical protein SO802_027690 [Lithocarpus litseifolius]|uniref:CCHC-type domain-containing protein n=1 Tax=Lithocarpus litseifolius TaxID=425828 RepID=A0AAW2C345_9ROSI
MEHLKSLDKETWKYLADIEPAQWTRSHFSPRALTDCLVNNLSKSFNSMIVKVRDKPILSMLEWIKVRLMSRLYVKKIGTEKYDGRPPMKRKRDADETRNPYKVSRANKPKRCGRCQKEGHNARGCKANGSGRPSTCRQVSSSSQPPPTHQPYTMASSSSNQAIKSQPPAPQPPTTQPPAQTPWSQQPSQWYSSDFRYTVRGAPWFASSQPAPHTLTET